MKSNSFFTALSVAISAILFSNCVSISGFQDGRTLGEGNGEFQAALNVSKGPSFRNRDHEIDQIVAEVAATNVEIGCRYGVNDQVDFSLHVNTNLNFGVGAKTQLVGDEESSFALSLGAEIGAFGIHTNLWNVQAPVYLSVHPSERFAWYLTPRYVYQFESYTGKENSLAYLGGNTGVLFGKRHKFGLDLGYYRVSGQKNNLNEMIQVGLGGRFSF